MATMQDTVMLGADFYETDAEIASLIAERGVPVGIGENTNIKYMAVPQFSSIFYPQQQNGETKKCEKKCRRQTRFFLLFFMIFL